MSVRYFLGPCRVCTLCTFPHNTCALLARFGSLILSICLHLSDTINVNDRFFKDQLSDLDHLYQNIFNSQSMAKSVSRTPRLQ